MENLQGLPAIQVSFERTAFRIKVWSVTNMQQQPDFLEL
jgi:hypothetical protein